MQTVGIIPARYGSTRFPGKPLAMIRGKTMVQRVYEQVRKCRILDDVVVATDDTRIADHVSTFGKYIMTAVSHASGTDRCAEAYALLSAGGEYSGDDCIINIQGDEPFIQPGQIELLAKCLLKPGVDIATLAKQIDNPSDVTNPHVVKVVFSKTGKALYFSRAPIPFMQSASHVSQKKIAGLYYKHIGLYGYRAKCLQRIATLPAGELENAEGLEQLRWLQQDYAIYVEETYGDNISVDVPEDLENL